MKPSNIVDALMKSNELFFKVVENNTIPFVFSDLETTRYLYTNSAFFSAIGYTKEETVGKTSLELGIIEPLFCNTILASLRRDGELRNIEVLLKKKNGDTLWTLVSGQTITLQDKKYVLTSFVDISSQKKMEKELYQLVAIVDSSEEAIISKSFDGIIKSWNRGAEKVFGYSPKEAIGKHISLIAPHTLSKPEKSIAERILNNEIIAKYETVRTRKDGQLVNISLSASPLKDETGKPVGISIIAHDITPLKRTEKKLSQVNQELILQGNEMERSEIENKELKAIGHSTNQSWLYARSLIEASADPLITISPNGKIMDVNEASTKVTGMPRNKLIGTNFSMYFTEPEKATVGYQEVFAKGFVADYPLTIKDDKLTDVLFNGSVYKDEDGNVLGAVVVARDITQQKRIEKELNEARVFAEFSTAHAEDAKLIAERAAQIAEDAVKAKQQFLSNMSHEIRTPMNAIIGFTKVLLKTDLGAKQREYLSAIKMSGDALIVLINDILDLAKVDAGKMTFEQTPFKMAVSLSAMLHLFEPKIQEKNLELVKEYDNRIPPVLLGDPVRLHQIILNLVSNAVKFTSSGKITVSVNLVKESQDKATIEFAVTDTGIGIPENKIEHIFENFHQATSGTSRLYGGTGLGLAIVKQLVEQQGGSVSVISKENEGSVFSFALSFMKTKAETESEIEIEEREAENRNIKVLVVEDIPLNQLLMKTLLDDFGFERDIAANGKIAIEKLQTKLYDIILMDLQMPEMNGFQATEYIRKELNSQIPIIALTADVTTVDLAKCKAVGMNDYIAKPIDERLLYSKMVGLVKKASLRTERKTSIKSQGTNGRCTDLGYLVHRTKNNPQLMREIISLYLEQTPPLITAMKESFKNKNWNSLQAVVHKMIPSFSIMGISIDFENMARRIKDYANAQQQAEGMPELIAMLEQVCDQACRELEAELHEIS